MAEEAPAPAPETPAPAPAPARGGSLLDPATYRGVIGILGATIIISITGTIILAFAGKTLPDAIISIASTAIGGLVGLLVQPPGTKAWQFIAQAAPYNLCCGSIGHDKGVFGQPVSNRQNGV